MYFRWSTNMFLLVLSLLVHETGFSVLANSNLSSLQKPKPLCHDQEKSALLHFKQSFLLDCSASYSALGYPKVRSWQGIDNVTNGYESGNCCTWDGVRCDEVTGHVIELDLSSSCLYGTFSPNSTLFNLDHLLKLSLGDNNFNYSKIPSTIGRLYKLTDLNLSMSFFSGQIPSELSKLSSLSSLDLSSNIPPPRYDHHHPFILKLHDPSLEKLVYNMTRITFLYIEYVDISSTMPFTLSNRTSLKEISLENCNLFGEFPVNFFQLPNLEVLSLQTNPNLGGFIPEFHSVSPLYELYLGETSFSGELPASLGNLVSLTHLDLADNYFSKKIPPSLGNLTNLIRLNLGCNFFSSDLPSSIMNLTQLETLDLSNIMNVGPGMLSDWLPKLNNLTHLSLGSMSLGNEILPTLSNFSRLNLLDLSGNHLTRALPSWIMNLTQLIELDLHGNQLQGPIPPWISNLVNLSRLTLSLRDLTVSKFDLIFRLPNLSELFLFGVSLNFSSNQSINSTVLKFGSIGLNSCNLTKFPEFLRHQDELVDLSLSGNHIVGDIPQWFVNITRGNLMSLDLSDNKITGFEQPSAFLPWKRLKFLNLKGNKFQGPLPSPPSTLQVYQISNNLLHGVIPKHICLANSLRYLDLSVNNLSGQIPSCIALLLSCSLQILNLRSNKFGGTIPPTFPRSCKLTMINLSQNKLDSKLPRSLVHCKMLKVFDVGRNYINDTFPSWLGSLPELQVLVLSHNNFHGRITPPLSGHEFYRLRIIDLSHNFHTGNLPSKYVESWLAMAVSKEGNAKSSRSFLRIYFKFLDGFFGIYDVNYDYVITITTKGSERYYSRILNVFRVIDFSSNRFTGEIPVSIGNLRGLQALNLSNNNLIGEMPSSLANITDLESLDLSQNMLSGDIPKELTMLTFLEVFNVSDNELAGPIPQGRQFSTFDRSSYKGNLALCGAPLSNECQNIESMPYSSPSTNDVAVEEDTKLVDWIIISLGCASGFIIGYILGKIYVTDRYHDWFMEIFGSRGSFKARV